MTSRPSFLTALALSIAACTSAPEGPTWHADVKPILDTSCNACHTVGGIAPFVLTDYASARTYAGAIKASTAARTMPPWLAAPGCTDYAADKSLTDAQIATLGKWADTGAAEGDPDTAPAASTTIIDKGLTRVDRTLPMPKAYAPRRDLADDYRCFLIDWPETTEKFVTGFRANPGNKRVVHHVIAFLVTPDKADKYRKLDDAEAGEGWTCYGAPAPNERRIEWLGAWAPGGNGNDMPEGTGIRVAPGSKIALQVHYNSAQAAEGDTDLSSVDVKLDDAVAREAFILPWTNPQWVDSKLMKIPAGAPDTQHEFSFDPTPYMNRITGGGIDANSEFDIHAASLHMHTLGTTATIDIVRKDAPPECMLQIDHWDFNWQNNYRFQAPKRFRPGDQLHLQCHWDNTTAKQRSGGTPNDVYWGEGTGDEMCLGILYISKL